VMMGQGIMPEAHHPVAAKLRPEELDRFLSMLRESVRQTVAGLPPHDAYVARFCAAQDRAA
jgi:tryptophan 7-halogenase